MAISNGYATLSDVKAALRIPTGDTQDDSLLEISIEAASRQIDGFCERVFTQSTATRIYRPTDVFTVDIDDLQTLTFLKTDSDGSGVFSTTWSATDYQLNPLNGISGGIRSPYTQIRAVGEYLFPIYEPQNVNSNEASVQIAGVWGFATIPTAIKQATIILSMRQFKRYDSPTGVMGFGDLGVMRVGAVDPDISALLMPFRRMFLA
jgi:Phage gp6-like head-tail connector protein